MKLTCLMVAVVALLTSCSSQSISEETLKADGERLAALQCEARKLQEERFLLAQNVRQWEDSVRFSQDSTTKTAHQQVLDELNGKREGMHLRTKTMADSITKVLDGFYEGTYKDTADRKLLDAALTAAFEANCPQ